MSAMKLKVKSDDIEFGTNILKVKVPKQLRNKVQCGVDYYPTLPWAAAGLPRLQLPSSPAHPALVRPP